MKIPKLAWINPDPSFTWDGLIKAILSIGVVLVTLIALLQKALEGSTWAIGVLVAMAIAVLAIYGIKVEVTPTPPAANKNGEKAIKNEMEKP
jgi:O-antigen/teichoic acid export membrane protein